MSEDLRHRIVNVAATMFAESGIKSIRMDDIAQAMGISKRTLYEQFSNKEQLLYQSLVLLGEQQRQKAFTSALANPGYIPAIFDGLKILISNAKVHKRISYNLQKFYPEIWERLQRENYENGYTRLKNCLTKLISEGLVKNDIDIQKSSVMLFYATNGILSLQHNVPLPESVSEFDAIFYSTIYFFRGVATLKGMEQIDNYIKEKGVSI